MEKRKRPNGYSVHVCISRRVCCKCIPECLVCGCVYVKVLHVCNIGRETMGWLSYSWANKFCIFSKSIDMAICLCGGYIMKRVVYSTK